MLHIGLDQTLIDLNERYRDLSTTIVPRNRRLFRLH
jgi:hypothetical protein